MLVIDGPILMLSAAMGASMFVGALVARETWRFTVVFSVASFVLVALSVGLIAGGAPFTVVTSVASLALYVGLLRYFVGGDLAAAFGGAGSEDPASRS